MSVHNKKIKNKDCKNQQQDNRDWLAWTARQLASSTAPPHYSLTVTASLQFSMPISPSLFFSFFFLSPISIWLHYSAPLSGFFPVFWASGVTLNEQSSYFLSSKIQIPSLFLYSIFPPFAFSPLKLPITSPPIFSMI